MSFSEWVLVEIYPNDACRATLKMTRQTQMQRTHKANSKMKNKEKKT